MLRIPGATALALALMVLGQAAYAERVTPPPVPAEIEVDAGSVAFLVGHAVGTQNYLCLPSTTSDTGFGWTLFTPEATLFSDDGRQLSTHFFSPKPLEIDSFRPTWQHSRDTSSVWARLNTPTSTSSDSAYVAPGAIPWLLLKVIGAAAGPNGGFALGATTQIQRLNTSGGAAPSTGCSGLARQRPGELGSQHEGWGRAGRQDRPVLIFRRSSSLQRMIRRPDS
jgi:hypothetical protein